MTRCAMQLPDQRQADAIGREMHTDPTVMPSKESRYALDA